MSNVLIVGGSIGTGKPSSVVDKIYREFTASHDFISTVMYNGVLPENLCINTYDLVLWFPDFGNEVPKNYPKKDKGAVLICSKVMREGTTRIGAVSRIFAMQGNAIVLIRKHEGHFEFELVDALNNTWCRTVVIEKLVEQINALYKWTKASKRESLKQIDLWTKPIPEEAVAGFIEINKELALKVAEGCGNRFFGNYSTRCTKLFPSKRNSETFLVSPRNIDKKFVTVEDLVVVTRGHYFGARKPSVDAPVQLKVYERYPNINFMIHWHALIEGAPTTEHYYPCGDLREVDEIIRLVDKNQFIRINLKNHGFLLMGETEEQMRLHLNDCTFKPL